MSEKINNGGPAFPFTHKPNPQETAAGMWPTSFAGMTLRDYFAAKAMQALLIVNCEWSFDTTASIAYAQADAMLAARGTQ